jgi:hypothetical protein
MSGQNRPRKSPDIRILSARDYLAERDTLDAFLGDFPSVRHEQATRLLAVAQERLVESLSSR